MQTRELASCALDLDTFATAIITSGSWDYHDLLDLAAVTAHKLAVAGVAFSVDDDWIDICSGEGSCDLAELIDRRVGKAWWSAR